jgi:hypothetical protein
MEEDHMQHWPNMHWSLAGFCYQSGIDMGLEKMAPGAGNME